ncbi:histone deacetylase 6-like [Ornithodoros turicata]|uniref:histone deacetylase 6-like n=1 Tax=Ornithodoros turicata TaxID=34597 RepID=UPI0031388F46
MEHMTSEACSSNSPAMSDMPGLFRKALGSPEPSRTGLVYDERMAQHHCLWDPEYPECPERLTKSWERCVACGLPDRCLRIPARMADEEEVRTLHGQTHLDVLKRTKGSTDEAELEKLCSKFDSIYINTNTYDLALMAVGSTKDMVAAVVKGKVQNGMALVRPPGHHAMENEYCGYCFFNNVAIAAKYAVSELHLNRVLIVDWDVHHGQATQYMFYDDPRVLYFSTHRYEHGAFWPELKESNFNYIGKGQGMGYNINIPLNKVGIKNEDFIAVFNNILMPVAYEYQPELVIVSSGYDAAIGCPEGCMEITPTCYAHLVNMLMGLAGGKVCVVLEGGYCISSLAEGVALTLRTLLGDPCPKITPLGPPCDSIVETILNSISVLRPFWKSLQFQGTFTDDLDPSNSARLRHNPEVKYVGKLGIERPDEFPTRTYYAVHDAETKEGFERRIEQLRNEADLSVPDNRTCLIFDRRMTMHRCLNDRTHPEKPERILGMWKLLLKRGLAKKCLLLEPRSATIEDLLLVHSKSYVEKMRNSQDLKRPELIKLQYTFNSVYLSSDTFRSALLAAGCLLQVVDSVCSGKSLNGAAIIRPPGHHAERDEASGFCIFNNVAIAARYAIDRYGLKRVLILDWDVHHGNGTQHAFYDDARVLYISVHRHDYGAFFPCTSDADYTAIGEGNGKGYNINVAWNEDSMTDGDYMAAFFHVILPVAYSYDPELILVSSGFDSCVGDYLGNCYVTPQAYGHFTHLLTSLAKGRVIVALEGGYNLNKIPDAMANCVGALLGEKLPTLVECLSPSTGAVESIRQTVQVHKEFWNCLCFDVDLPSQQLLSEKGIIQRAESKLATNEATSADTSLPDGSAIKADAAVTKVDTNANTSFEIPEELIGAMGGLEISVDEGGFVSPEPWCPHLDSISQLPSSGLGDPHAPCIDCGLTREVWACLHCFQPHCGRYVNGHMVSHHDETGHNMVLSFTDISVWCYACNVYVSNSLLDPAKEDAYTRKFGKLGCT